MRQDLKGKFIWNEAKYVKSAHTGALPIFKGPDGKFIPEVVFVGRSNAGKSSLINHLTGISDLARVSKTPGKTAMLHFFTLQEKIMLVDLPGYGFAKVPDTVKAEWAKSLQNYFSTRSSIALIFLLIDIRREPSREDIQMIEWASHHGKEICLVLTKTDKLNQKERKANTEAILTHLNRPGLPVIYYSTLIPEGQKNFGT